MSGFIVSVATKEELEELVKRVPTNQSPTSEARRGNDILQRKYCIRIENNRWIGQQEEEYYRRDISFKKYEFITAKEYLDMLSGSYVNVDKQVKGCETMLFRVTVTSKATEEKKETVVKDEHTIIANNDKDAKIKALLGVEGVQTMDIDTLNVYVQSVSAM